GLGHNMFDNSLIVEEMAYACSGITIAIHSSKFGQIPVILAGNDAQKKKYLGRIVDEPLHA
ncbi:hypothetical protein ILUMI_18236, partial [Ignelater luminosus]